MINRFNHLTAKEWLPFQKSWFKETDTLTLYRQNVRFFTQSSPENPSVVFFFGNENNRIFAQQVCDEYNLVFTDSLQQTSNVDFAIFDIRELLEKCKSVEELEISQQQILSLAKEIFPRLTHRKFLAVFSTNVILQNRYFPFSWTIAKNISQLYSLKDEKIGCSANGKVSYSLYFRKDEKSQGTFSNVEKIDSLCGNIHDKIGSIPSWFVLKPQPRKKDEILHPAKFPEELVKLFLPVFSSEGSNVLDPMAGTGSVLVASLLSNRNAFGTELSQFFGDIAKQRCANLGNLGNIYRLEICDARNILRAGFPEIDYLITSPPYWDMLNMKGAENQAKRREKGLQLNYSEEKNDLGNIADYEEFVNELAAIYRSVNQILKPGAFLTIVVKNIKKKGSNYPLAWDLAKLLCSFLELYPESFWCQDDLSIAPYGYGNTWVSNTFHHYCLNFRKPL